MAGAILGGFTKHDAGSAELAADIINALKLADISQFSASLYMWGDDAHECELSHALAGRRPLNAYLLTRLPPAFWVYFLKLRAQRVGHDLVEDGLSNLLEDVRALLRNIWGREAA